MGLEEAEPEYITAAISFKAEAFSFPKSFFLPTAHTMPASVWWQEVGANSILPDAFVELMVILHTATVSSATLERIFSSFGLLISKLRTKLGL